MPKGIEFVNEVKPPILEFLVGEPNWELVNKCYKKLIGRLK